MRLAQKCLNWFYWIICFDYLYSILEKEIKKTLKRTLSFKMNKVDAKTYSLSLELLVTCEQSWWTGLMNISNEQVVLSSDE